LKYYSHNFFFFLRQKISLITLYRLQYYLSDLWFIVHVIAYFYNNNIEQNLNTFENWQSNKQCIELKLLKRINNKYC